MALLKILKSPSTLFAMAFSIISVLIGCKPAAVVPGVGRFLRVDITERDSGEVRFSRTDSPVLSSNCEMECEFEDGSKLRVPCESGATLECPISTKPIHDTRTQKEQLITRLPMIPAGKVKTISVFVGSFPMTNPVPGGSYTFQAIFPTNKLPVNFRIWSKGKPSETIKIKIGVRASAVVA